MEMGKTLPFFAIPPVGMKECSVTPLLENAGVLTKWATRNQELVSGVINNIAMRQVGWVIYVVHITYPNHESYRIFSHFDEYVSVNHTVLKIKD